MSEQKTTHLRKFLKTTGLSSAELKFNHVLMEHYTPKNSKEKKPHVYGGYGSLTFSDCNRQVTYDIDVYDNCNEESTETINKLLKLRDIIQFTLDLVISEKAKYDSLVQAYDIKKDEMIHW